MATHEGFKILPRSEYERRRDGRLIEHDIVPDQVYTALFRLVEGDAEAASNPVRTVEKEVCRRCGIIALTVALLDIDLRPLPTFNRRGHMENGLWDPPIHFTIKTPVAARISEMYLEGYDDGMPHDWFVEADRPRELVGSGSATH